MRHDIFAFCLLALPITVHAHHSRAEFADQTLDVEGVLTRVVWQNPHIALFVDVEADDGTVENWRIEGFASPTALERSGVRRELFEAGDHLAVVGQVSKFRKALLVTNILLEDGTEVLMDSSAARLWDGPVVGDSAEPEARLANAATDGRGLFRAWYPAGNPMRQMMRFPFTAQAAAARADWDPVDNPIVRCEPAGMPGPLFHPRPIEFSRVGDDLGLRHAYFDTRRRIHMADASAAEAVRAAPLGFSRGRWEDERTLVVETTDIDYPYFDNRGTIQGAGIKVTERYTLSEDQTRLDLRLTIEDPVSLTEPAVAEWHFLALDEPFSTYECNVF